MSAPNATAGLIQSFAQERVLLRCVLVSIALHALVLVGMSSRRAPAPAVETLLVLTARLVPIPVAPREPDPPKPALPPPPEPAAVPRPRPAKPSARPAPEVKRTAPAEPVEAPQPESAPTAPSVEASAPSPATAIQTIAMPAAPSAASVQAAPAAPARIPATEAAAKSGKEADTGTLEEYRLALIVATRRYKRYPAIALEKGWQGRVDVHMVIDANGMVASASIKTGSGYEVLDKQALDMLKKGKTTVPIPAGLRGREFSIDVPVIFNLENSNS
ncbi:MAG: TonB family protein [Pseudomonadota bacterium]